MDITRLEEFVSLSRTLNYSETAAKMHLAQSTLSKHVIALEKELGIALINHDDRPTLTEAGALFSENMSDLLNLYRKSISQLEQMKERTRILVATTFVGKMHALKRMVEFAGSHPDVVLDYRQYSTTPEALASLKEKRVDCAIYGHSFLRPRLDDNLRTVSCGQDEMVLWVDKTSKLAKKRAVTPRDLEGYSMPTPTGRDAETITQLHEDFASAFAIDLNLKYRHFDSVENFFLSKVEEEDILVFHKDFESNDVILLRDDRIVRPFTPPVMADNYVVFPSTTRNQAVEELHSFLLDFAKE